MEFVSMIGIAMLVFFGYMFLFSELFNDNIDEKKHSLATDLAFSLQNEFIMASEVNLGYRREFTVPENLDGYDYDLANTKNVLIVNYTQPLVIPETVGNITKGINVIENLNGTLCLNC